MINKSLLQKIKNKSSLELTKIDWAIFFLLLAYHFYILGLIFLFLFFTRIQSKYIGELIYNGKF